MKPNAEHKEQNADFGELLRERLVCNETGCERPNHYARDEVAHDRRQSKPIGNRTKNECKP